MIPESTIREIADRLDIVEVIGEYLSLKRSGSNWVGLCPFHSEKSPSFNVNPSRNIFHCFGCGVGGNVFSFVMKMDSISFPEAVMKLGARVGITVREEEETPERRKRREETDEGRRIMELAASWFRRSLSEHPAAGAARDYLARRGVDDATAERYALGFAPNERDGLVRHLTRHRVSLQLAERLGVIRSTGGGYGDLFRNRIIFPIRDLTGHVVAFGGRIIGEGSPKYLNSPESPLYRKSSILFGLHDAKRTVRDGDGIIIVEGYFDHLAMTRAGFANVVATCGTALTEKHVQILRRFTRKLYLMFDGDTAGERAAERVLDVTLGQGVSGHPLLLPPGEDPDTFVSRVGPDPIRELMASAPELFDWYVSRIVRSLDISTVQGKMTLIDTITPKLRLIEDPLQRGLWISEISRRYLIDEIQFRRRFRTSSAAPPDTRSPDPSRSGNDPELLLLALIGRSSRIAARAERESIADLLSPSLREAARRLAAGSCSSEPVDWEAVISLITPVELQAPLRHLAIDDDHFADADEERMYSDILTAIQRRRLKKSAELRMELARAEPGSERHREILMELETLRNTKSGLLSPDTASFGLSSRGMK